MSKEYNNLRFMHDIVYNMACCEYRLGEEEHMVKTYVLRAYHGAYCLGDYEGAKVIKKDAEESFGIIVP